MEKLTEKDLAMYYNCEAIISNLSQRMMLNGFEDGKVVVNGYLLDFYSIGECDITLLLRPLSDISDEEVIDIAKIIYGQPDSVKWKIERNKYKNCILVYRRHYSKRFTICLETGEIDCYEMDGEDQCNDTYTNQHFVTKYLISKAFDVFSWIPAGLAIDVNTIKK